MFEVFLLKTGLLRHCRDFVAGAHLLLTRPESVRVRVPIKYPYKNTPGFLKGPSKIVHISQQIARRQLCSNCFFSVKIVNACPHFPHDSDSALNINRLQITRSNV